MHLSHAGSGCFLHPGQEARSNGWLNQHFVPHDVTSSKILFIDFQSRWYIVQCHIVQINIFCKHAHMLCKSINPHKSWWVVVRQMSWPVAECPIHGQSEPAATNAPVGRSVQWMDCVFSFGTRWGSSQSFFLCY